MHVLRLTGTVVSTDVRSGTTAAGAAYSFRTARVMVPMRDFVEVVVPDRIGGVAEGEIVDWFVRVSPRNGRLRMDVAELVPSDFDGAA